MNITAKVKKDMVGAMKAGDRSRAAALRYLLSQLQMGEKEAGGEFNEEQEIKVLANEKKRRRQAAEAFRKGGSDDRADREESEAAVIDEYLPQELAIDELKVMVEEAISESGAAGIRDMGKVMSLLMPRVAGRADGNKVSEMVRAMLAD